MKAALTMEYAPKPIPDSPTHCRVCGLVLEPLRRWGGLCRDCVPRAVGTRIEPANDQFRWREVKRFLKKRDDGIRETFLIIRCVCGAEREQSLSEFQRRKSGGCNKCKLEWIRKHGVESDTIRVTALEQGRMSQRRKRAGSSPKG